MEDVLYGGGGGGGLIKKQTRLTQTLERDPRLLLILYEKLLRVHMGNESAEIPS